MGLSFKEYVSKRRLTDTPAGDFVRDARADRALPDAESWEQLHTYLITKGAIPEAIAAARVVWRSYRATARNR